MSSFSEKPTLLVNDYEGAALFKAYDTEGNAVYYRVSK